MLKKPAFALFFLGLLGHQAGTCSTEASGPVVEMGESDIRKVRADLERLSAFTYRMLGSASQEFPGPSSPEANSPSLSPSALEKIEEVRSLIISLTGRLERLEHQQQVVSSSLEAQQQMVRQSLEGMAAKLKTFEDSQQALELRAFEEQIKNLSEKQLYEVALKMKAEGKRLLLEKALVSYLGHYPKGLYGREVYMEMALLRSHQDRHQDAAFYAAQAYKAAPSHPEAPEILFRLSHSLIKLNKFQEAVTTLRKIESDFQDMPVDLKARVSTTLKGLHSRSEAQASVPPLDSSNLLLSKEEPAKSEAVPASPQTLSPWEGQKPDKEGPLSASNLSNLQGGPSSPSAEPEVSDSSSVSVLKQEDIQKGQSAQPVPEGLGLLPPVKFPILVERLPQPAL